MPQISIAGRPYFYRDVGQGVPLVLLHGFPFTGESFAPQLEAPPRGVRLLVPDHRGFGQSGLGSGVSTMEAMADDAMALLDALGLPDALVGGVSMGGYVALALARLNPGRVRGLVLTDTQSAADDEAGRARREATAVDVLARGSAVVAEALLPRLMAGGASASLKAQVDAMMRAQSAEAVAAASRGMATRTDGRDILSRFAGPVQIIVGRDDVITPLARAEQMASYCAQARIAVIEGAGHLSNLEQPVAFNAALQAFVDPILAATSGRL